MTFRLWRYLLFTDAPHGLLDRTARWRDTLGNGTESRRAWGQATRVLLMTFGALLLGGGLNETFAGILVVWMATLGSLVFLPVVFFNGPLAGAVLAVGIARRIAAQRVGGAHYDLLCCTPAGEPGVIFAITSATLRNRDRFSGIGTYNATGAHLFSTVYIVAGVLGGSLVSTSLRMDADDMARAAVLAVLVIVMVHGGFRQSVILGTLCGVIGGLYGTNRVMAQILAVTIYAGTQLAFALILLLSLIFPTTEPGTLWVVIIGAGLAYGTREGIIGGLWVLLRHKLGEPLFDLATKV